MHDLLEVIHSGFQVFDGFFSQDVWVREVVQFGQVFVSDPEDVQSGFIPGLNFIIDELAPTTVGVVLSVN
jgi:hypothetical protein